VTTPASGLRIGDAERSAAADRLAWHFSHGRLDQGELDERLAHVMRARTAGDLTGVFDDLPADGPVPAASAASQPQPQPHRAGRLRPARLRRGPAVAAVVLTVCIIAVLKLVVLHPLPLPIIALGVIALIAALRLRRGRVRN
jgi:hypothetical protein